MTYTLQQLAVGSYDLILGGEVIGSVVREQLHSRDEGRWFAELFEAGSDAQRPAPFVEAEHTFDTLGAVVSWLGEPEVIHTRARR